MSLQIEVDVSDAVEALARQLADSRLTVEFDDMTFLAHPNVAGTGCGCGCTCSCGCGAGGSNCNCSSESCSCV